MVTMVRSSQLRMRLLNNVERAGQTTSTPLQHSEHSREQKKCWTYVEAKSFKLFQHRFNFASTRFNTAEMGWQTLSTLPFNKIERMLKQMLKPFARALRIAIDGNRDFPINELGDISHLRHLYIAVTCCNTERERLTSRVLGNHRWHVCWCANLLLSIKWVKNKKAYKFCHCAFSMLYQ